MSQRGGCVVSHVRINSRKSSSIIPFGGADMIIAFELAEAARSIPRLGGEGCCIVNTQVIKPVSASLGNSHYDSDELIHFIKSKSKNVYFIDGYSIAAKAGSIKAVNVVLLGAATAIGEMPFTREVMEEAIIKNVPQKFRELNQKAFKMGFESVLKFQ
jgi:indolepyruvate ferredoxin oxidoreductase beta subunit